MRKVVRAFGPNRHVTGLQITNEVNLTVLAEHLGRGVQSARSRRSSGASSRPSASRAGSATAGSRSASTTPGASATAATPRFWDAVGRRGGARLRRATDWVGLDLYPGHLRARPLPGRSCTSATPSSRASPRSASATCRRRASGARTPIRIEETGLPDRARAAPTRRRRRARVDALVRTAVAYRGTYGISDFRWFGLRDNNSQGPNFQSFFGLLHDDYSPKPAFATYRRPHRALRRAPLR